MSFVEAVGAFFKMAAEAGAATLTVDRPTARRPAAINLKIREFMEQILLSRGKANGARGREAFNRSGVHMTVHCTITQVFQT